MDVSFIISSNELFTLLNMFPIRTDAGRTFFNKALCDADICDLSELIDKKLARLIEEEMALDSVLHLIIDAISYADSAVKNNEVWEIKSPWVNLNCSKYPFNENHWRITPIRVKEK